MIKTGMFWALPVTALIGALFCAFSALGITTAWCVTDGCDVYKDYSLGGISLYWFGAGAFIILFVLALMKRLVRWQLAATWLLGLGSVFFLALQFFLWPCTNCLIVAFLLGVCIVLTAWQKQRRLWILGGCWMILFGANLLALAKSEIEPYPAYRSGNASLAVYFSPSCPACRQVVETFLAQPATAGNLVLYPLAKDASEQRRIALLLQNLQTGMAPAAAFNELWGAPAFGIEPDLRTRLVLWRNQVAFSRLGITQVPVITSTTALNVTAAATTETGCSIFAGPDDPCEEPLADPFKDLLN